MSEKMHDVLARRIQEVRAGPSLPDDGQKKDTERERAERLTAEQLSELDELVHIVASIRPSPISSMSARARTRIRSELLQEIARENAPKLLWYHQYLPARWPSWATRSIAAAIVAALMAGSIGGAAVYASNDALPGNALYSVKTTVEQLQLVWPADDTQRAGQYLDIAARRASEASVLGADAPTRAQLAVSYSESLGHASNLLVQAEGQGKDVAPIIAKLDQVLEHRHDLLTETDAEVLGPKITGLARAMSVVEQRGGGAANRRAINAQEKLPTSVDDERAGAIGKPESVGPPSTTTFGPAVADDFEALDQELMDIGSNAEINQEVTGLRSKLETIQAAIERGQVNAVQNNLDAFDNQLLALRRSGRISDEQFKSLHERYESLSNTLRQATTTTSPGNASGNDKGTDSPPAAPGKPSNVKPGLNQSENAPGQGPGADAVGKPNSASPGPSGSEKSRGLGPPQLRPETEEDPRDENRATPSSRSGRR